MPDAPSGVPVPPGRTVLSGPIATVAAAAAAVAALASLCSVVAVAARSTSAQEVITTFGAVAALGVLHGGVAALALPSGKLPARCTLAVGLGLANAGIAVWLSGMAGSHAARWWVLLLPAVAWLPTRARSGWLPSAPGGFSSRLRRAAPVLLALSVAWALAARSLALSTGPLGTGGPELAFYVDVPWHIALTSEALDRAPQVYPWIPDVPIGYSWLFFGALALLGNVSGTDAGSLVLVLGPAVLAVLVPAGVASCTWAVSRSRAAAVVAVLLWEFGRGLLVTEVDTLWQTPQWVLINRDLTNALVPCIAVLLMGWVHGPGRGRRTETVAAGAALGALVFGVAASRGGAVLPVAGMALLCWEQLLRRGRRVEAWSLAAVVTTAVLSATTLVTRSSGSFSWGPMTFLPPTVVAGVDLPLRGALSVLLCLLVVLAAAAAARFETSAGPPLAILCGGVVAGVAGTALVGHPTLSQLYFFHAAWPLLVCAGAVALVCATRIVGWPLVIGWSTTAVLAQFAAGRLDGVVGPVPGPVRAGVLLVAAAATVAGATWSVRRRGHPRRAHLWSVVTLSAAVLALGVQVFTVPESQIPTVVASEQPGPSTVGRSELVLLQQLRDLSDPDDLVATNRHCITGSVPGEDCDARWFLVSAFAERRVLVEGWSYDYTWATTGTDNFEPYWDPRLLTVNDGFIAAPTTAGCEALRDRGVQWIWADHSRPWSPDLGRFGHVVGATEHASLYRLESCDPL